MTTHTSQGVAGRIGYGLGMIVRLAWFSQNRTVRWVKRLALIALAVYFAADIANWVVSVAVSVLVLAGGLLALNNSARPQKSRIEYGQCYGPDGYGYYVAGQRVDDDD